MRSSVLFLINLVCCAINFGIAAAGPEPHPISVGVAVFNGITALYMLVFVARDAWRQ